MEKCWQPRSMQIRWSLEKPTTFQPSLKVTNAWRRSRIGTNTTINAKDKIMPTTIHWKRQDNGSNKPMLTTAVIKMTMTTTININNITSPTATAFPSIGLVAHYGLRLPRGLGRVHRWIFKELFLLRHNRPFSDRTSASCWLNCLPTVIPLVTEHKLLKVG